MNAARMPWLLAALALLLYLALGQNALHGLDAYHYLRAIAAGEVGNPQSALYYPLGLGWSRLLGALGVPLYEALRALSAVAAAAAVLATTRAAAALGLDADRRIAAAALLAALPAVLHTATVVEVDAIVLALACLAWWPFARLLATGRPGPAALAGLCTAAAALFHAAGHLLALSLVGLALVWGWPARPLRRALWPAACLLALHAAVAVPLAALLGAAGQATMAQNTAGLSLPLSFLPRVLLREWLLPYLLPCLLVLLALRRRELRAATVGLLLGVAGYVLVTTMILATFRSTGAELPQGEVGERGAFLLALAPPLVLLTAAALPRRLLWLAAAATLAFGAVEVLRRDWPADPPGFATGYAAVSEQQPLLLIVADVRELAWLLRRHPGAPYRTVAALELEAASRRDELQGPDPARLLLLSLVVEARRQAAAGRALAITPRARARLLASEDPLWATAGRRLEEAFALEPLQAAGFAALRLRPR